MQSDAKRCKAMQSDAKRCKAMQSCLMLLPPPPPSHIGAIRQRHPVNTLFRRYYQRGDLPISIDHCGGRGNRIKWRVGQLGALDYHVFLPIFVDGTADFCGTRVVVCYAVDPVEG
jgi:hypothetical protein